ncbi:MAG TPA: ABC transporter permease [Bryobacteraceae bacterium]
MRSLRLVLRNLRKSPGFAIYTILSLALGIGANTALFSIFDEIILKPLPVVEPDRLVVFHSKGVNSGNISSDNYETSFSYPLYLDLVERLSTGAGAPFESIFARAGGSVSVAGVGEPDVAWAESVTGNFFDGLGLKAAIGRLLNQNDDLKEGANPVVVVSYGYWKEHFGGRADVVGQKLLIDNHPIEIIGVAPEGFDGMITGREPKLYYPLHLKTVLSTGFDDLTNRRSAWIDIFGRLRPGAAISHAEAQAAPMYRSILEDELRQMKGPSDRMKREFTVKKLDFIPAGQGINVLRKRYETQLAFLLGMVGLILLIACANVANLFTVRAIGRRKEMAVRVSMGATRSAIVGHLLVESLVLSVLGGVVATVLGYWMEAGLTYFVSSVQPGLHWHALVFNFALALVTALLFGLVPALQASNPELATTLKDEGGAVSATTAQGRLRQALALAQLALALTLLTAAGLFARSLGNLQNVDLGFSTDHILTFELSPSLIGYTPERAQALFRDVQKHLEALPGVQRAATVLDLPLAGSNTVSNISIEGYKAAPDEELDTHMNAVSPGYFEAMGIRKIAGRTFEERDGDKAPKVAIVTQSFSRKWLKGASPVGMHFGMGAGQGTKIDIEIVGMVADQKTDDLRTDPYEYIYRPLAQAAQSRTSATFVVRSTGDENALGTAVRQVVRELDANLPVRGLKSMAARKAQTMGDDRLISILTAAFGVLATILAALGLYAVLAFTVAQRTKEIGIRMALGATESSVTKLVLTGMLRVMIGGVIIGLIGAFAIGRWAESLLYGLKGFDPLVIVSAVALLTIVAFAAATLPARRAARTDPVTALRQ